MHSYYKINHLTRYLYSEPVTNSAMEVRMQPRSDDYQVCTEFHIKVSPVARVLHYRDYFQNHINIFDIPGSHGKLAINTSSVAEVHSRPDLPDHLNTDAWRLLRTENLDPDCFDMLQSGHFTTPTDLTREFTRTLPITRDADPLMLLKALNTGIYQSMDYDQSVTTVDSHIDVALEARRGVCQDFAHIMATITRELGIPCRYVSGYLFHREDGYDRSAEDATHAWVEAWLPTLGWVGFDPTNNLICGERHIGVCIGRDYADAAPTRGVFTGTAETSLEVSVKVIRLETRPTEVKDIFSFELPNYEPEQHQSQQ
jgi:transglutaminase-like putative cysteine protease